MSWVIYNSKLYQDDTPLICLNDRAYGLADGIFETIKISNSLPELWSQHMDRLKQGCLVMALSCVQKFLTQLYQDSLRLIAKSQITNGVLKIIISRNAHHRGLNIKEKNQINTALTLNQMPSNPNLLTAHISKIRRNETSPLSQIKSLNYGDNMLALNHAQDQGYDEALMLNTHNIPCCFTSGNLVIETDKGEMLTPLPENGCLKGCFLSNIPHLQYSNICLDNVFNAKNIWRSNSIFGLVPVKLTSDSYYNASA